MNLKSDTPDHDSMFGCIKYIFSTFPFKMWANVAAITLSVHNFNTINDLTVKTGSVVVIIMCSLVIIATVSVECEKLKQRNQ